MARKPSANLVVDFPFTFGISIAGFPTNNRLPDLTWQTDALGFLTPLSFIYPNGFQSLALGTPTSSFQNGPCPGFPCGILSISSATMTDLSPVPGPILGTGIFSWALLSLCGWWLAIHRSVRPPPGVSLLDIPQLTQSVWEG